MRALRKGWAALTWLRVRVMSGKDDWSLYKTCIQVQRGHAGSPQPTACCSAEPDWECPRTCGRTVTQRHFCTNGGCLALPESHQAKDKTLQHFLHLQSWPCSEARAGPETSRGLQSPLVLQLPGLPAGNSQVLQVSVPGLPAPTWRYCRCLCSLPGTAGVCAHSQVLQVSVPTPIWLLGCLPARQESSTHKKAAGLPREP